LCLAEDGRGQYSEAQRGAARWSALDAHPVKKNTALFLLLALDLLLALLPNLFLALAEKLLTLQRLGNGLETVIIFVLFGELRWGKLDFVFLWTTLRQNARSERGAAHQKTRVGRVYHLPWPTSSLA
jgi:hypothetical protein